jgi:anti-sigma-K factor RskA
MSLWSLIYSFTFHFQTNYRMSAPICALLRSIGQECGGPPEAAAVAQEEGGSLPSWLLLGCGLGAAVVAGLAISAAAYFACRRKATPAVGWPRLNDSRGLPLLELTLPR